MPWRRGGRRQTDRRTNNDHNSFLSHNIRWTVRKCFCIFYMFILKSNRSRIKHDTRKEIKNTNSIQNILWKVIYIYLIFNTFANSWNCLYCTYFQFKIYHGLDMLSTYRRNVRTPRSEKGAPPGCSCSTWLSGGSPSRSDSSGRWPGSSLPTLQPIQRNTESKHIHRQPKVKQTTWQRCWFTRKYQNMFCLSLYRD